jgi:predicted  nucleic acid-binding Zn-ribbon protein
VKQHPEDALNTIVKLTEQSGNLKKVLKSIHETVSNMRNLIFILKDNLSDRISENSRLQKEVKEIKKELEAHRKQEHAGIGSAISSQQPVINQGRERDIYTT